MRVTAALPSEETSQSRDWKMLEIARECICVQKHSMNKNQTETETDGAEKKGHEKKTGGRTRPDERKTETVEKKEGRRRERGGIGGESRQSSVRMRTGRVTRSSPLLTCLTIHG